MNTLSSKSLIAWAVIISFVVGGISGMAAGVYGPSVLQRLSLARIGAGSASTSARIAALPLEDASTIGVVKKAGPGVVSITISKDLSSGTGIPNDFFNPFFNDPFAAPPSRPKAPADKNAATKELTRVGGGSGFFVTSDGLIVTNKHVVADAEAEYSVVTQDGKKYPAKVLALDPVLDLAFIKVEGNGFPALAFGDSDTITVGETVIAIGNALDEFQNTVTKGVISGVDRRLVAGGELSGSEVIEGAIQTDAAINPGNSGGPLLDLNGKVIGINTAVSEGAQSLGFALPANLIGHALASVKKDGRIVRPWIGVRYIPIDEEYAKRNNLSYTYGALILRGDVKTDVAVIPGSPADKAGLTEHDIILALNGQKLDDGHSLSNVLSRYAPGDKITLTIVHQGKEKDVTLTLEERKNP